MKTVLSLFTLTLTCLNFQLLPAQSFKIKGGLNLAKVKIVDDGELFSNELRANIGYHLGFLGEFDLTESFSVETGLLFDKRGSDFSSLDEFESLEQKVELNYLTIPLALKGTLELNDEFRLFGNLGSYLAMGLSGEFEEKYTYFDSGTIEEDNYAIEWGNDEEEDFLKRLDFGLTFGAGIEISEFEIGVSYDLGLANIVTDGDEDYRVNNRLLRISVGYVIGN